MSGPNMSSAVMAQRVEPHDSLDFFPTPPWATRALLERVLDCDFSSMNCWEPACGRGDMARPLAEQFGAVFATDVHDHGFGGVHDFLMPFLPFEGSVGWIITNPPFRLGEQFILRALDVAQFGVAMLVRSAFLESDTRYKGIFSKNPPSLIAQFVERVPMFKGRLDPDGSTATAYCWLIWDGREAVSPPPGESRFTWIAPCRSALERPGDYAGYMS